MFVHLQQKKNIIAYHLMPRASTHGMLYIRILTTIGTTPFDQEKTKIYNNSPNCLSPDDRGWCNWRLKPGRVISWRPVIWWWCHRLLSHLRPCRAHRWRIFIGAQQLLGDCGDDRGRRCSCFQILDGTHLWPSDTHRYWWRSVWDLIITARVIVTRNDNHLYRWRFALKLHLAEMNTGLLHS